MQVEVVRMRVKGEKRPTGELKGSVPVLGSLMIDTRLGRREREQVIVAQLVNGIQLALPILDHVRITRLKGNSFVLFGFEEIEGMAGKRDVQSFPQAWWVRLPTAKTPVFGSPDVDDEPEDVRAHNPALHY